MHPDKILKFLTKKGWKEVASNENAVSFQSPAKLDSQNTHTVSIPTQTEIEGFDSQLQVAATAIAQLYETDVTALFYDVGDYLEMLKQDAIYFKLNSNEVLYRHTLELEHIWQFLRNLNTSYSSYLKIKFHKEFGALFNHNEPRLNKAASKLLNYSHLRLVDLEFQSFSFGVSVDTLMGNEKIDIKEIGKWRQSIMSMYKKEVIDIDYTSKSDVDFILQNFSSEARKKIYAPIIKSINQDDYSIAITNAQFQAPKLLSKIPLSTLRVIVPGDEKTQDHPKQQMVQIIVPLDKSKSKITLKTKEIENDLFSQVIKESKLQIDKIDYKGQIIELKSDIELVIKQEEETGEFIILFTPLNYEKRVLDFRKIKDEFFKDFLTYTDYYQRLKEHQKQIKGGMEKQVFDFFKKILPEENKK